ncbi:MAG: hypothetical protein JRF63_12270 [Deltaproteobacteria bacterium]|nr:hypothetical protein [Deltaproteobacteria bacterium]
MLKSVAQTNAFDIHFQLLECPECGGPLEAPPEGGLVDCEFCGNIVEIVGRDVVEAEAVALPVDVTIDRRAELRKLLGRSENFNIFDVDDNYPPDLGRWKGKSITFQTAYQEVLPELREAWRKALLVLGCKPDDEDAQFRVYWLAVSIAFLYEIFSTGLLAEAADENPQIRRRSVLETAMSKLRATKYGYVLRCKLSRAASGIGDVESARGWLAACDPEPDSAELDTEFRIAVAAVHVAEANPQAILGVLGSDHDRVLVSGKRNRVQAGVMRIHAFEISGNGQAAELLLSQGYERFGASSLFAQLNSTGLAPKLRKRHLRQGKVLRWVLGLIVLGVLGGIAAGVVAAFTPDGEAVGSLTAHGGASGGWNVALDFCAMSSAYPRSAGVEISAEDYPGYGLRLIGTATLSPPWTLHVMSPQLPVGAAAVSQVNCAVLNAQVAPFGTPNAGAGNINADCMLATGERVIIQTSFHSCE